MRYPVSEEESLKVVAYGDASWAASMDGYGSVSGFVVCLADAKGVEVPILWGSRKQKSISRSSGAAELKAVDDTLVNALHVQLLVREIFGLTVPIVVHSDSQTVIDLLHNKVLMNPKDKSLIVRVHHLREKLLHPSVSLIHIAGTSNIVDEFTKPEGVTKVQGRYLRQRPAFDNNVPASNGEDPTKDLGDSAWG